MSKDFKIFGIRGSLIGDSIMALVILNFLERRFPGSYKYWQVARKCGQAAPLFFNHPLIDKIVISDCEEGMGPKDRELAAQCQIVFDVMPNHPFEQDWPNYRDIYQETFIMAGLPPEEYHKLPPEEQRPKLVKWFNVEPLPKHIAIWPCAGYGVENKRNPSQAWYKVLVKMLNEVGFKVIQFGHPRDFALEGAAQDMRHLSFFDQIKMSLGCDLAVSTDSGSGLVLGAYEMRQVSLLTNHFPGHVRNLTAFAPNNPVNTNFVGVNGADNISQREVFERIVSVI